MIIRPRTDWDRGRWPRGRRMTESQGAFVHCSAGRLVEDEEDAIAALRAVKNWHLNKPRPFRDFGYSFAFDNTATIWEGRGWGVAGAHTRGYNTHFHGFMWLGGASLDHKPSQGALDALGFLAEEHARRYGPDLLRCHNDVARKSCPGPELTAFVRDWNALKLT
ncbi:MAG: hypothetical protein B7733_05810 [Myxococcales bacterium FL481]|nr:MAG: hypothetical protein B7733_05810 [Myxococcales bacterium FL481]